MKKMNPLRKKSAKIAIIIIISVLICFGVAVLHVYYSADESTIPMATVNVAGTDVSPSSAEWTALLFGGILEKDVAGRFDEAVADLGELGDAPYELVFGLRDGAAYKVSLNRQLDAGTILMLENAPVTQNDPAIPLEEGGTYVLTVQCDLSAAGQGHGRLYYSCSFSVKTPDPEFVQGRAELQQGDIFAMRLAHIPKGVTPTAETELGTVVFSRMGEAAPGEWFAAVPVGNARPPGTYSVRVQAGDWEDSAEVEVLPFSFDHQNLIIDTSIPSIGAAVTGEALAEFRAKVTPLFESFDAKRYWSGPFIRPVEGGFISTQFGEIRITNGDPATTRSHYGMDFAVSEGVPVHAGNAGKVLLAEFLLNTGGTVVIEHGGGLKSLYYHMSRVDAVQGETVKQGDLIGAVGSTGYSTGPHLHYEMRIGDQAVSPSMLFEDGAGLYSAAGVEFVPEKGKGGKAAGKAARQTPA